LNKNFQIFRSSAGSGKTYTLSLSYIALALMGGRYGYADYYRKILAITFTNKAASEMKERVLEYLESLSESQDKDGILDWLLKETKLEKEVIFKRSKVIHNHILHHYADLGISTIDKFTYKIVRTFATDLGLAHNFDLEMDNYKIIQPVVALLLGKISDGGGDLSNALIGFALQKAEDGKSTNIERDLEDFAQQLFKEEVSKYISEKQLTVGACMQVKKDLQIQKDACAQEIDDLADSVCLYFDAKGLTKEHFKSGTFYNFFTKNVGNENDKKWIPSDTLQKNIANDDWVAKSKSDEIKGLVEDCKTDLQQFFTDLMILLPEYISVKSVLKNMYSIAVLNELMAEVKAYKKEQNVEQIAEFNKKIHQVVTNQPSSFIYERLGERYNHYLIDEFQDTSLLQWQNILPLITDSLDCGKSLLVGDGKQSIYRWRGGEVEQFFQLPTIYKGDNLVFKKDWESKLNDHYKVDNLVSNFRSRKEIITFNNQFFETTKTLLSPDLLGIYDNHEQECDNAKEGGYVHIQFFDDKEDESYQEQILEKIILEIQKLKVENNFNYKDITILCASGKKVALVAESLSLAGIPVISNEGLLLIKSDKVNMVLANLRVLQNPENNIAKSAVSDYLYSTVLANKNFHDLNIILTQPNGFDTLLKKANIFITPSKLLEEPLYEMVEQLIRLLNLKEDVYLQFFLDVVLAYSEKKGSSLSEFLLWWEERKNKEAIVVPESADAVQVMTIHKSKGLAFNVVMIPFNWDGGRKTKDIWVDTSTQFNKQLPAALISSSKNLDYSYFKDEYRKEKNLTYLDNLNKLYVAMTRPKVRLYVFAKAIPEKPNENFATNGNMNSMFYKYAQQYPLIIGNEDAKHSEKPKLIADFKVDNAKKLEWREVISLKHSAEEIWDIETQNAKKDWGKLLHLALEGIHYTNQKQEVIDALYSSGKCTKEDYEKLKVTVDELLSDKEILPYFSDKWKVKTEKEILMPSGITYIPDRLLFDTTSDKVIIIDYKTGKEEEKHIQQITNYSEALFQMGEKNIEKILIYTNNDKKIQKV